jgi:hypothetical protein
MLNNNSFQIDKYEKDKQLSLVALKSILIQQGPLAKSDFATRGLLA